jgi:hypothetical protein
MDMAAQLCPEARKDVHTQFFKTLDQAFSKYLFTQPRIVQLIGLGLENGPHGGGCQESSLIDEKERNTK